MEKRDFVDSAHTSTSSVSSSEETSSPAGGNRDSPSPPSTPGRKPKLELPSLDNQHTVRNRADSGKERNDVDNGHNAAALMKPKKVQVLSPPPLPTIPSTGLSTIEDEPDPESDEKKKTEKKKGIKPKPKRKRLRKHKASIAPRPNENTFTHFNIKSAEGFKLPSRSTSSSGPQAHLPIDQYECILERRAIRKNEHGSNNFTPTNIRQPKSPPRLSIIPSKDNDESKSLEKYGIEVPSECGSASFEDDVLEIEGDTSLGMKLTILSGKVIVQGLVSLQDGRASPAQVTGLISRGDVLLSINNQPIVGLGLDLLMVRLKPLSSPDEDGLFARYVKARFAVGEGLMLLQKDNGKAQKRKKRPIKRDKKFNAANYTMVDQLSGLPLFHTDDIMNIRDSFDEDVRDVKNVSMTPLRLKKTRAAPLPEIISINVAIEQQIMKSKYMSRYFSMNEKVSSLLHPIEYESVSKSHEDTAKKKKELFEKGKLAVLSARRLYNNVELGPNQIMDPLAVVRNECRSFSSRSRYSQKYAQNNAQNGDDSSSEDESDVDSMASGELGDGEIGDEMLLRLAVWNRTWKKRMVETLEAASIHTRDKKKNASGKKKKKGTDQRNKDSQMEFQLQSLFFGSEVSEIMNKKKPTVALPPGEITEILFDLSARVTATIPTNVNIINGFDTSFDEMAQSESPFGRMQSTKADMEVHEATRFLLDDILPAWIDTFKPIPNHQRRVLWPSVKEASSVATPDDLSMESAGTGWSTGTPERRAKLEDKIAHLELDPDTRIETCELLTFYFTRKILPAIKSNSDCSERDNDQDRELEQEAETAAVAFVYSYGSYLKLFESLVAVSDYLSEKVLKSLLTTAKNDPNHIDCMKQLNRNLSIMSYEPKFLSCLLFQLNDLKKPLLEGMIPLIVASYPDIKPWQVRSALPSCRVKPGNIIDHDALLDMEEKDFCFYYNYLSSLMDSSSIARMDEKLVQEWCIMSTSARFKVRNTIRRQNFMRVCAQDEFAEVSYHRDLSFLIDTSACLHDTQLTLQIAEEIITKLKNGVDLSLLVEKTLNILVSMAMDSIKSENKNLAPFDSNTVQKVLELLSQMSVLSPSVCNDSIVLSDNILQLLNMCTEFSKGEEELVRLLSRSALPQDFLKAFSLWETVSEIPSSSVVCALRLCLKRAAESSQEGHEQISTALSRVREIRQKVEAPEQEEINYIGSGMSIWETMERGIAVINK